MVPVYFVVPAGLVLLDLAGPAEAFRIANKLRPGSFALHYCGPEPEVECGLAGLHLSRLAPLPASLPAQALVVVPGVVDAAFQLDRPPLRAVVDWLARCRAQGRFDLMSVCSGALLAAAAGLLAHRECTSHHHCLPGLARLEPTARIHDNRIFVEDDGIWTSAGVTAGIDLALYLVSRACGPRVASAVARDLVVYLRRAGTDPAISPWLDGRNHMHPGVHRVQDAIVHNPAAAWTPQTLAAQAHTSARHLSRLFAEHAGCTPMDYLYRVRLALARELIRETRLDLEHVAERAGFGSAHHMRRVWRRHESGSPSAARHPA
ncbi:GlxA family transcriptional regulator [Bordetella bronchiseptica]|uniref:GlxA family transcriptional regulator n=1 Tax=Bordetella bronchiseptica TaxID=518 RepID=UPI00028A8A71|nr:helix-turn-helix domain-containing protein [Bordetella bronchiseptica]KDD57396.1 DNA-binding helix-turn-helix protein [Bordetella bronchiseptica OSU553]AUL17193.1 AraC family transcriptional regulator [Bordetella bronchiseptica]AWP60426.1 AraC family transcriptional regulator [Bordetella bronchiseptica]AWQ07278.1 AraC family transcriptional regulator [Bordetella bronchiseptica]KAK50625.1 DNA-binding helix-turn-helix protein [Bordetella bronchiseptica OSU054]